MPLHHGAFHRKQRPDVERFFTTHCARLLHEREEQCRALQKSMAFAVDGKGYTLDLARAEVLRHAADDADANMEIGGDDFVALLEGKLDVARAIAEGRIKFSGEVKALAAVLELFAVDAGARA